MCRPLTLGLDGNLYLEVEVKTKLQSFLGSDGGSGLWGRHVLLILSRSLWSRFYMSRLLDVGHSYRGDIVACV